MTDKIVMILKQLERIEDKLDYIIQSMDESLTEDDYDDADIGTFGNQRNGIEVL